PISFDGIEIFSADRNTGVTRPSNLFDNGIEVHRGFDVGYLTSQTHHLSDGQSTKVDDSLKNFAFAFRSVDACAGLLYRLRKFFCLPLFHDLFQFYFDLVRCAEERVDKRTVEVNETPDDACG